VEWQACGGAAVYLDRALGTAAQPCTSPDCKNNSQPGVLPAWQERLFGDEAAREHQEHCPLLTVMRQRRISSYGYTHPEAPTSAGGLTAEMQKEADTLGDSFLILSGAHGPKRLLIITRVLYQDLATFGHVLAEHDACFLPMPLVGMCLLSMMCVF